MQRVKALRLEMTPCAVNSLTLAKGF